MTKPRIYAGIGSRQTPNDILHMMKGYAQALAQEGWLLRSGHADAADKAFEAGSNRREIHLPWAGYNVAPRNDSRYIVPTETREIRAIAERHHPRWHQLNHAVQSLMCRNVTIMLGLDLKTPVEFGIAWTPEAKLVGGTSHAIKVAEEAGIPVFNLGSPQDQARLIEFGATL